jgi:membrane protease YdiL (CAAX protease family)
MDEEIQDSDKNQMINKKIWDFCPVCGTKIPKIQNLKYCINCGTDLNYLKEHKQLKPGQAVKPYIPPKKGPKDDTLSVSQEIIKISDDDLIDTKNYELWGTMPSIGISLAAFLIMDLVTAGVIAIFFFLSFNSEAMLDFLANPYFLIFSSFFEIIFILVPVLYVGKYLRNPSLKNRLTFLGFTSKGFSRKALLKEILIGLGMAVAAYFIVYGVSVLIEITLEFFFGVDIIQDLNTGADIEILFTEGDYLSLFLLASVMILIVGTSEEILFRGFMQKGLSRSLGNLGGLLTTAFIFAMIHVFGIVLLFFETPLLMLISFLIAFAPYFIISLVFGLIYYWRKENLIAVILTHGVYNALTIIITYFLYYAF